METKFSSTENGKDFLFSFLNKGERQDSKSNETITFNGQNELPTSLYYLELLNQIKASLAAMKAFAFLSRDHFKDQELGEHFYKIINQDIEKTISMLDCFNDYLNFSTPLVKKDTVTILIEEMMKKHKNQFEEKKIKIIKKQFEKDLPETSVPDEQLRYILDSVIQYTLLSMPANGSIGFLTRLFDIGVLKERERGHLPKDGKYIEILVVSTGYEKGDEEGRVVPGISNYYQEEEAIELILKLAKEIIKKNRGMMRYKVYEDKPMTFISLVLPIERRNIIHYPSPEDRLKKTIGIEK